MSNEPTAKLFVGNLAWTTDNNSLGAPFAQYGTVVEAVVIMDRENPNRSRGYGFVTMSTPDEAAAAKAALEGKDLDGREIRIDFAQPKNDDRGSRGDWAPRPSAPSYDATPATDEVVEAADASDQE
jgi:heterogeneous nuclear ribonucleoprotein A1/A3